MMRKNFIPRGPKVLGRSADTMGLSYRDPESTKDQSVIPGVMPLSIRRKCGKLSIE
jgi:hypothetical protein